MSVNVGNGVSKGVDYEETTRVCVVRYALLWQAIFVFVRVFIFLDHRYAKRGTARCLEREKIAYVFTLYARVFSRYYIKKNERKWKG